MRLAIVAALLAVLLPASVAANAKREGGARPDVVMVVPIVGSATGSKLARQVMPWSATIQALHVVTGATASGGGAGNTLFRFSDGTSNCDVTLLCTVSNVANSEHDIVPSGTCSFMKGAAVTASIVSSTCTTTQPSLRTAIATGIVYR